ncbi:MULTISPECIES: ubiquinol-cytochrome C chaperone family protein [Pseudovibrio]|uniref:ubiquinol-cytochrome C chaperone family protein n=1 Tax=Stappiaceae TaxID=2821832 RepID=UPI0023672CA5|nr:MULTISPECIES: ubiquinol-cytochrome C chaperone family protein [Pseudovibrio]MDD7908395.1 ubiquinol-cytochrome C chaperone family protein [Pseudovibrio exalbescens]MDX5592521.1 ubiquinol-cytochrome C chaperone family protein [Pseudovibrio sp. SPO723]
MIFGIFRRRDDSSIRSVYEQIVAQARQPYFYTDLQVPDTVEGRFEMIVLHAFLVFHRLRNQGKEAQDFSQGVFDLFFQDMDQSMREMGIGDEGVRRRIRAMTESFYGRSSSYAEGLSSGNRSILAQSLLKNIYGGAQEVIAADRLVDYMQHSLDVLGELSEDEIRKGRVAFAAPDTLAGKKQ